MPVNMLWKCSFYMVRETENCTGGEVRLRGDHSQPSKMGISAQAAPTPVPPSTSLSSPGSSLAQPPPPSSASMTGVDRLLVDRRTDCSVFCRWSAPSIATTKTMAVYSPYFEVREGVYCRLVVYPRGESQPTPPGGSVALALQVIDRRNTEFGCFIYYKFSVLNHLDASKSVHTHSAGRFTSETKVSDLRLLTTAVNNPELGFLEPKLGFSSNGSLTVTADVRVLNESASFTPDNNERCSGLGSSSSEPGSGIYSGKFTWTVKNFSLFREVIKTRKLMSPCFPAGECCDLRISVYQSVADKVEYLSLCLDSNDAEKLGSWCLFKMSVLNKKSRSMSIHRDGHGRFGKFGDTEDNSNGSCFNFVDVSKFMGPENGYLVDDTAVFIVSFQAISEHHLHCTIPSSVVKRKCDEEGFVWQIENFPRLKDLLKKRKITGLAVKSMTFPFGNQVLRMVIYPRGNSQLPSHLSFFLEVIDERDTYVDWSCFVSYRLSIVNQKFDDKSVYKHSIGRFSNATKELGWSKFMTVNSLLDKDAGFLVGDTISFMAAIVVLKETFLMGKAELRDAGFPVDPSVKEDEFFLWKMDNFSCFEEILETKKLSSRTFKVGDCELQIGLCKEKNSICAFLESDPSVMNDPDKNVWVSYRMALVNQKNFAESMWKESSFCTKSTSNSGIQFMKVSDMLDPHAGYLVHQSIAFCCQILDHSLWFDFPEPGASDYSKNTSK